MSAFDAISLQREVRKFVSAIDWNVPFAATLTLKQARVVTTDRGNSIRVPLTEERAIQNFRHFQNLLSAHVYGPSSKRFNRKIKAVPVIEGGSFLRTHYHALIDCPRPDLVTRFPSIVADCWRRTDWGYDQIHVVPNADEGWMRYITKLRSKPDFASAIDWMNFAN